MTRPGGRSRPGAPLFAALYFAEGAPIGFVWWALPVWLRTEGVPPAEIARIVALVGWPWALKFLWAPLLDRFARTGARLAAWVLACQLLMAAALLPLLGSEPPGRALLLAALLAHAVFASTQDVGIDALAVRTVPPERRGRVNGWMQVGMLGARALFGGGAILLAARVGERAVVAALVAAIVLPALLLVRAAPAAPAPASAPGALRAALRRRTTWIGLAAAATLGAGFESMASMAGPFLVDRGASEDLVGTLFLAPTVVCMAAGALLGGLLSDRAGRVPAALASEALAAVAVLAVGAAAWTLPAPAGLGLLVALVAAAYFAMGLATAGLYALLMDHCDARLAATQFALFMGGINLCYVGSTRALGLLLERVDYGPAFCAMAGVSLLALPLLVALGPGSGGAR